MAASLPAFPQEAPNGMLYRFCVAKDYDANIAYFSKIFLAKRGDDDHLFEDPFGSYVEKKYKVKDADAACYFAFPTNTNEWAVHSRQIQMDDQPRLYGRSVVETDWAYSIPTSK
jgi:hypothetical protein